MDLMLTLLFYFLAFAAMVVIFAPFINRPRTQRTGQEPILFFDGFCGLCNLFIILVMGIDRKKVFRFAPLQGETAKQYLSPSQIKSLDSLVVVDRVTGVKTYEKSSAVLKILSDVGGVWRAFAVLGYLPKNLLDGIYDIVARNRYAIIPKRESCRVPTEAEKELFLP